MAVPVNHDMASSDEKVQSRRRRSSQRPRSERRHSSQRQQSERHASERDAYQHRPTTNRHSSQRTSFTEPVTEPLTTPARAHVREKGKAPTRPGLQRRRTTARTRYIDMLLGLDHVSPLHNILASAFVWILLAGYIVFPATFNSLQKDSYDDKANTRLKAEVLATARNVPLLYVAAVACGVGVLGCIWLWWKHRANYVWVINRIFLPSLLNSIAGLVSTLVNVYSAQDGQYSVTAKVTIVVTAACSVVTAALFLLYNTVMLRLVKRKHDKEIKAAERGGDSGNV